MRPWVLRALIMTLLYGVGQTSFVALSARLVDLTLLWSVLLLGIVLAVGLVWGGAEVIADRVPPEWTWLKASLVTGPAAGLLSWILLLSFVDSVGVEDLGASLVGRASFTVLLVLASVSLGSRFGWLSLRRSGDPRADQDPGADVDEPAEDSAGPSTRSGHAGDAPVIPASTAERVAARRARRLEEREQREAEPGAPSPAAAPSPATEPAPRRRATPSPVPAAAGPRRTGARGDDPVRVPFGTGPFADPPSSPTPAPAPAPREGGYASPVVAVLPPVTPLPSQEGRAEAAGASGAEDHDGSDARRSGGGRRRFGLRRPGPDAAPDTDA